MANLAQLCIGTELPNLFKSTLFDSPILHLLTFAKFRLWDMYVFQPEESLGYLKTLVATLLLVNITLFFYHLAVYLRPRIQGTSWTKTSNQILALNYFARPALLLYFEPWHPAKIIVNMALATTSNLFYSDQESHVNFVFHTISLHYVMVFELFEYIQGDLFLWVATIYIHTLLFFLKLKYYTYFTSMNETHYFTCIGACWNYFCLFWVMSNPNNMWVGSLQLFTWFNVMYFESFGVLTPAVAQGIMIAHFYTTIVSRNCVTDLIPF